MTLGEKAEMIAIGLIAVAVFTLVIFVGKEKHEVVYNCNLAEISPDIPLEVKEQCRKLRMENIK